jgi:endonuclease/exonuclease/phosphatase family metal-dependent hydrolase
MPRKSHARRAPEADQVATMRQAVPILFLAAMWPGLLSGGEVAVMSFNCWYQFSKVRDGIPKAVASIKESGADVVGLQECSVETADKLAESLGFHRVKSGAGGAQIISRFPVLETFGVTGIDPARAVAAKIQVAAGREIIFYNIHLDAGHYGPYAARPAGATAAQVMEEEAKSQRPAQMAGVLKSMAGHLVQSEVTPVILTGDFNSPSHLDWVEKSARSHFGITTVSWPATKLPTEAGLVDSFRLLHPDPVANPGTTWSTIHKENEPQDRIDYIFHKGSILRPVSSRTFATTVDKTVGPWGCDIAPVANNVWPSDHAAVITVYQFGK